MAKVVIISGFHVCNNPRVLKEADALSAAGHCVETLGAQIDPVLTQRDADLMRSRDWTLTPVVNMHDTTIAGRWRRFVLRLRKKLGRIVFRLLGWENPWQLGYATEELLLAARRRNADLYIVHLEQALWVGARLLDDGRRVGVDMEDWYSNDLPDAARRDRPIAMLQALERRLLCEGVHRTCTSHAMSKALVEAYGCPPPTVVYNVFSWSERELLDRRQSDRRDSQVPSIYWFSQTIGPGRGLEDLFAALPLLPSVEIHLRGEPCAEFESWLAAHLPSDCRAQVHLHGVVSNDELISRMAEHDLGFAGEVPYCANKHLTASNKIFHYLLGGLAVVASDTAGQREALSQAPGAGVLYAPGDAGSLASAVRSLLAPSDRLRKAKAAALEAARTRFCAEIEYAGLLHSVAQAIPSRAIPAAVL